MCLLSRTFGQVAIWRLAVKPTSQSIYCDVNGGVKNADGGKGGELFVNIYVVSIVDGAVKKAVKGLKQNYRPSGYHILTITIRKDRYEDETITRSNFNNQRGAGIAASLRRWR